MTNWFSQSVIITNVNGSVLVNITSNLLDLIAFGLNTTSSFDSGGAGRQQSHQHAQQHHLINHHYLNNHPHPQYILNTSASNHSGSASGAGAAGDYVVELTVKNVLLAVFLISLGLLTILGNTFVLLAIFIDFHLRSPTHYLMGSLAVADLLLGKTP